MSKLPDTEAWAIFAKVAELGSFSAAAADLGLSKATVSKAVTRLEQRLKTPLLHRTSRQVTLTGSGQMAFDRASRMVAEAAAAEDEISDHAQSPSGVVKLAAPMSFGIQHLGPLLPEFLARYPDISVDLHLSDAQVDLVGGGFDLALRIASLTDSSLRAKRLCNIRRILVGAPSYMDHYGKPSHPKDLNQHHTILFSHLTAPHLWHLRHPEWGDYTIEVEGRIIVNNADIVVPALLAGAGLAIQPEFVVWEELKARRLIDMLPGWEAPLISLHLVTPPGHFRPARVRAVMDFLAEHFRSTSWAQSIG